MISFSNISVKIQDQELEHQWDHLDWKVWFQIRIVSWVAPILIIYRVLIYLCIHESWKIGRRRQVAVGDKLGLKLRRWRQWWLGPPMRWSASCLMQSVENTHCAAICCHLLLFGIFIIRSFGIQNTHSNNLHIPLIFVIFVTAIWFQLFLDYRKHPPVEEKKNPIEALLRVSIPYF